MCRFAIRLHLVIFILLLASSFASAQLAKVTINSNITTSTLWSNVNWYELDGQIIVESGVTLTIEAGTVVSSGVGDSLTLARGAQIIARGERDDPIVFTSDADVMTWLADPMEPTRKDPETGIWRETAEEWGGVVLNGEGYISDDSDPSNTPPPSATNEATAEGLLAMSPSDPNVLYGGGDDLDDSGILEYVSIRYAGSTLTATKLNGLTLNAVGQETDIRFIDIMNSIDDGVEIRGGKVNLEFISIWNVGDDSFDIDEGWRGKAQFLFIVQGHCLDAPQGQGVGDVSIEIDGAEDSDWQPRTRATVYNATVVGQPIDGNGATAWRDNAGVQFRNCIIMDTGGEVVQFDNLDGDGHSGYGFNGTTSWPAHWLTPALSFPLVNPPANPGTFYDTQTTGFWAEMSDSVFYNNPDQNAYTEANLLGVFTPAFNNVQEPMMSPIRSLTRGLPAVKVGGIMVPVTNIDPRAEADALTPTSTAPADGFFTPAAWRGAFDDCHNWCLGWTAADAYGFYEDPVHPSGAILEGGWGGFVNMNATLDVNDALNASGLPVLDNSLPQGQRGPHYTGVLVGGNLRITVNGEATQPFVLWSGPLNLGFLDYKNNSVPPGRIGSFDTGTVDVAPADGIPDDLIILLDGFNPVTIFDLQAYIGPTGRQVLNFNSTAIPAGTSFTLQAIANTSVPTPFGFTVKLTNAVKVRVY